MTDWFDTLWKAVALWFLAACVVGPIIGYYLSDKGNKRRETSSPRYSRLHRGYLWLRHRKGFATIATNQRYTDHNARAKPSAGSNSKDDDKNHG